LAGARRAGWLLRRGATSGSRTLAYFAGVAFTAALVPALGTWGGGTAAVFLGGLIFAGLMVLGVLASRTLVSA